MLNYYNANKLRESLEDIFHDDNRSLFDDPDWPKCWSNMSPAKERLKYEVIRDEPVTDNQMSVLKFFNKYKGVKTKGVASVIIEELLSYPLRKKQWYDERALRWSNVPATEPQLVRIRFACESLGVAMPRVLSKQEASNIIDSLYSENEQLEDDYQSYKFRLEELEFEQAIKESEAELLRDDEMRLDESGAPASVVLPMKILFSFFVLVLFLAIWIISIL